jgi:hypothetical protein
MKFDSFFIVLLGLILLGTAIMIFTVSPEEIIIISDDGLVEIDGSFATSSLPSGEIKIQKYSDIDIEGSFTAVESSMIYTIEPEDMTLPQPLEISMKYKLGDQQNVQLGYYDQNLHGWRFIQTYYNDENEMLYGEINRFGKWALLNVYEIEADEPIELIFNQLLKGSPENSIGFNSDLSYSIIPGDYVFIDETYARGGCGGNFNAGINEVSTSLDREVLATIDGIDRLINLRINTIWEIGAGCADDSEIARDN